MLDWKSLHQTIDGGYIITGNPKISLIKTDSQGNLEWEKLLDTSGKHGGSDYGNGK